ncbi:ester cyclase [Actinophytocola oryzae]|uniref:SnoaL-like protein n=1 Tax=Actinophytocola oryzae TaxID=502181 RepID=A0A4R7W1E2_9PSEU|nr:ester cyclase [Actinophytocola oryzae]TDV56232.1 SnoaL-like protein [Actinophytocola oryzae]
MTLPIAVALRRYAFGFVNSHDFTVCRELMTVDYGLHMGDTVLTGRDDAYIPAVRHQMEQFPDLGFEIHELITDGEYAALHFSEHGTHTDRGRAAWPGVSIYRFDGERLAECWVEQDHYSRRRQLAEGAPAPMPRPALAPFSGHEGKADDASVAATRSWLGEVTQWPPPNLRPDPGPYGDVAVRLTAPRVTANVVVGEGGRAAFHATVTGAYAGGLPEYPDPGLAVRMDVGGFVSVVADAVGDGWVVTNRVAVQRQLRRAAGE